MESTNCARAARTNLADARGYLEKGQAINWVPDKLRSALHWAMEAWLLANNLGENLRGGWDGTRNAFWHACPPQLRSKVISCYAKVTYLNFDLEGGLNHSEPLPPMDVWLNSAFSCLVDAEQVIVLLTQQDDRS